MVAEGATTIWENWGLSNGAESMIMWATIDEFFYRDLAGISGPDYYGPDYMRPGFRQICIKPYVPGDLEYASASVKTVRGNISSGWKTDGKSLTLEVSIPVNSEAQVSVPKMGLQDVTVTEGRKLIWKRGKFVGGVSGVTAGTEGDNYITFDVGSGCYVFQLSGE